MPYAFCEQIGKEIRDISDEIPFEIPESWEWCRLSFANDMYTGNSINESEKKAKYTGLSEGRYYIGTKDVEFNHTIVYDNGVKIPFDAVKFRIAPCSSILMCIEGGSAGRKIAFTDYEVCFGNKLCCFVSWGLDYMFLYYYLQSPIFQSAFKENTTGIIGGVSVNTLKSMLLPVPPIDEQKRIVERLTQLVPVLDEYGKAETHLTALNTTFPEALKKSILQEAVQGKLVPQNPDDEPASVLLERIRAEKQALIKAGKIKRDKHESVIVTRDKIPYEIPDSWAWCRLSDICHSITDGDHQPPPQVPDGKPFIVISNISGGGIDFSNTRYVPDEYYNNLDDNRKPVIDDILFTVTGSYGIVMKVNTDREFCFQRHIALLKPLYVDSDFLVHWLRTPLVFEQCKTTATGTAQKTVGLTSLKNIIIPLPPLSEQKRIVEKIEEFMQYCDKL